MCHANTELEFTAEAFYRGITVTAIFDRRAFGERMYYLKLSCHGGVDLHPAENTYYDIDGPGVTSMPPRGKSRSTFLENTRFELTIVEAETEEVVNVIIPGFRVTILVDFLRSDEEIPIGYTPRLVMFNETSHAWEDALVTCGSRNGWYNPMSSVLNATICHLTEFVVACDTCLDHDGAIPLCMLTELDFEGNPMPNCASTEHTAELAVKRGLGFRPGRIYENQYWDCNCRPVDPTSTVPTV